MDWMERVEACNYYGITEEELEDLVVAMELDVEVDDDGRLSRVEAGLNAQAVLFALHEAEVGYSPWDEQAKKREESNQKRRETIEHNKRKSRRALLHERVTRRASG